MIDSRRVKNPLMIASQTVGERKIYRLNLIRKYIFAPLGLFFGSIYFRWMDQKTGLSGFQHRILRFCVSGLTIFFITVFLLFSILRSSCAESQPVGISADNVNYDYETKQLEAVGNARLTYKDIIAEADKIIIDQNQNILLATGNVRLTKKDQTYQGNTFLYYLKTQQGWIAPLSSDLTDPEITGAINLDAAWALIKKDDTFLDNTSFTSCDLPNPHYHFTAASVEYYPEKRIIFHRVWYWEHQVKLLYLPYLVISLEDKDSNFEVEAGWKKTIGWFLYVGYNYFINEKNGGKIKLNLTELGGNGIGVEHHYKSSESVKWTGLTDYYDNGNYDWGLKYDNSSNKKLPFSVSYANEGWSNRAPTFITINKFNFNLNSQIPYYPTINFSYNDQSNLTYSTYNLTTSWNVNIDPSFNMSLTGRWYQSATFYNDYTFTSRKDFGWSNLQLVYNDTNVFYADEYKPKIIYTIPSWKWPFLGDMKIITEYDRKEKNNILGERDALDIVKNPINIWKNPEGSLILKGDGSFKYRYYTLPNAVGDVAALTGGLTLADQITKEFSGELGLSFTQYDGYQTTFFGTEFYPGATLTNGWKWIGAHLSAQLNTGYNFQTEKGIPVVFNSSYAVDQNRRIAINGEYDWNVGLRTVSSQILYNPNEHWKLNLSIGYDFQVDRFTNGMFEAVANDRLTSKIGYELASRYDFFTKKFSTFKAALTYDLHCRELKVSYDAVQEVYWVQILIKAFPQAPLRLDSENGLDLSVFN